MHYIPVKIATFQAPAFTITMDEIFRKEQLKINHNFLWDTITIDWQETKIFKSNKQLHIPSTVTIPIRDKIKFRFLTFSGKFNVFLMAKQGSNWINILPNDPQQPIPEQIQA